MLSAVVVLSATLVYAEGLDVLWLARAMVNEADYEAVTDHIAIGYVLVRKSKRTGVSVAKIARVYSTGMDRGDRHSDRHLSILELDYTGNKPEHWDGRASWKRVRPQWMSTLQRARGVIAGKLADPCGGRSVHWGGPMDKPSKKLRRIDCGKTANYFYEWKKNR